MAVPTRGTEAEGHPIAAPGTCVRLECDDLAGVVGAFPRAAAGGRLAELSPGPRISGCRYCCADRALGRLPERRERAWLEVHTKSLRARQPDAVHSILLRQLLNKAPALDPCKSLSDSQ